MRQMLHPFAPIKTRFAHVAAHESYQTDLNHDRHSNSARLRLTLVMLSILRVPLMCRTAIFVLLLVSLAASPAFATRNNPARTPAQSSVRKTASHPARRSGHLHSKAAASPRTSAAKRHAVSHPAPSGQTLRSSTRRSHSTARHRVSMRRARYGRHARARIVPLATVTVPPRRVVVQQLESDSASQPRSNTAEANPTEPATTAVNEPGTIPPPGGAAEVAAGNALAAPRLDQPLPAIGQIAELNVPRVYGRYALRGTHDSLVRQNQRSEEEALERIEDDNDLHDRITRGLLVPVPQTSALIVNTALPEDRRYCRPWTADFLNDLSRAHEAQFHKPLIVSSAVRTVEYQKHLMRFNHNAADAEGDIVSPHITGATIDIAKSGLSRREMQWMRDHLFAYQTAGVIDVEEEFRQRCFHITVYKSYAPASSNRPRHAEVPQTVAPMDTSTATTSEQPESRNQ